MKKTGICWNCTQDQSLTPKDNEQHVPILCNVLCTGNTVSIIKLKQKENQHEFYNKRKKFKSSL